MDANTYKAARILIAKFGDGAIQEALERQLKSLNEGNTEGFARWGDAVEAIQELLRTSPRHGKQAQ